MKALMIFAHPDDEIIWGWPVTQNTDIERHLITISDNGPNYEDRAEKALKRVCEVTGVNLSVCMNEPNEYYRLPMRHAPRTLPSLVERIVQTITKTLDDVSPDYIVTHNPFGEYGHGDHRLVFNVVSSFFGDHEIRFTDACQWNKCHLSFDEIPLSIRKAYFSNCVGRYKLNQTWFDSQSLIYKNYRAWSWGLPHVVPWKVRMYSI